MHLVSLNENFFKESSSDLRYSATYVDDEGNSQTMKYNNYDLAETIYHEIKSHIEDSTGDVDQDHAKYGSSAFRLTAPTTKGSPAETIINELIKVRENSKKEKNDKN